MIKIKRNEAIKLSSPHYYNLITTIDQNGRPNIMGISWWMFTSWDPFMIAISVGNTRYTHQCLEYCREFVLCLPCEEMARDAWFCGTQSGKSVDKFAETGFTQMDSLAVKPPTIKESAVAFECKVSNQVLTGDHTLFIANVVGIQGNPENACHLRSIHYNKLIALDFEGNVNWNLKHK